jgi:CBS domain containing-hemolysin-like protein
MTLLVVYICVALGVSFLCSTLEAALLSTSPAHLAKLEQDRPKVGARLRALKSHVDRPLAAILSLNTTANTVGAAGVGAEAQRLWGSEVLAVTSAVLTLSILFLAEIIPKTLGAIYWRRLSGFIAAVLPPMILLLFPLVRLSEAITGFLKSRRGTEKLSREEFAALARIGEEQGVFDVLAREALMVPDTVPLPALFEKLLDRREHIAVVVDEYGGVDGVVTMEDVFETLIGIEIVDEMDSVRDMRAMARAKWEVRAKHIESIPPESPKAPDRDEGR